MKVVDKKLDKIMTIMSWTHMSDDDKRKQIDKVLSQIYDLGFADGYAVGLSDFYK